MLQLGLILTLTLHGFSVRAPTCCAITLCCRACSSCNIYNMAGCSISRAVFNMCGVYNLYIPLLTSDPPLTQCHSGTARMHSTLICLRSLTVRKLKAKVKPMGKSSALQLVLSALSSSSPFVPQSVLLSDGILESRASRIKKLQSINLMVESYVVSIVVLGCIPALKLMT